jgi:hypothetical protein
MNAMKTARQPLRRNDRGQSAESVSIGLSSAEVTDAGWNAPGLTEAPFLRFCEISEEGVSAHESIQVFDRVP